MATIPATIPSNAASRPKKNCRFDRSRLGRARIINYPQRATGDGVGYGSNILPARASKIAVLAAGYGDAFTVALGNKGSVLLRGPVPS